LTKVRDIFEIDIWKIDISIDVHKAIGAKPSQIKIILEKGRSARSLRLIIEIEYPQSDKVREI
jgi:hypothetical protein